MRFLLSIFRRWFKRLSDDPGAGYELVWPHHLARKALATSALALAPLWVMGATGDIIDIQINADGWTSSNVVSGLSTGGTYANGLGATAGLVITNMLTGSEKYVLNVTSSGYTTAGAATTWPRKVYGTKIVRIAGGTTLDEQGGSNLTNRFALSDWIFSGDTITRTIASGWVTQGGNPNNATSGGSVANNSPYVAPLPIGTWSSPQYRKVSGSTMRLSFVVFHAYPRGGKPVACVKFIVSDQHSHTVTNIETAMRIDYSLGEKIPSGEYFTDIALGGFTAGDQLTCDVEAFPWIGTASSILDTSVVRGWEGKASWHPITRTNVYDGNNTYCPFIATVDAVSGSDSLGRATNTTYNLVTTPFLTLPQAMLFIQNSNNSFATPTHNDPGGGIVYLHSNVTNMGNSTPAINRSACEVIIAPYPGEAVTINKATSSASESFGQHIRWTNITFASASDNYALGAQMDQVVADNCTISNTAAVLTTGVTNCWIINSHIIANTGNFTCSSGLPTGYLWRNCFFDTFDGTVNAYLMMGCHRDATNGYNFNIQTDQSGFVASRADFATIYNNKIMGLSGNAANAHLGIGLNFGVSNGVVRGQNVFEYSTNAPSTTGLLSITADTLDYTNLLNFNNTDLIKENAFYNDAGTTARWKMFCFMKNNVVQDWNIKSDLFGTPSANRIGNWSALWGVGWTGNAFLETTNTDASGVGDFLNEFTGLNAVGDNVPGGGVTALRRPASFMSWVNPQYFDGGAQNSWPGGGTYRINNNSSALNMNAPDVVVPNDIEGVFRGGFDPPGAYASASPRKGGAFFGQ